MSSENESRATLDLPGAQQQMLETAVQSGKPVVLVLENGRPLDIRWASEHVPAILEAWYPGTEGGNAMADVLFGDVNPGGKLPVSWPRAAGQEPLYYNHNLTHEPEDRPTFTSRYWDLSSKPLFPFGYGLSYTTFKFENVRLGNQTVKADGATEVSVDVTNVGSVAGDTVAQVYIHQRAGSASRPVRQLKGFKRVTLQPGETADAQVSTRKRRAEILESANNGMGCRGGHVRRVGRRRFDGQFTRRADGFSIAKLRGGSAVSGFNQCAPS